MPRRHPHLDELIQNDRPPHHQSNNYTDTSILRPNYLVTLLPYDKFFNKPRYRGDIYDGRATSEAKLWEDETEKSPYLHKIRSSLKAFPSLRHLASWMEVSTSETRYMHLSQRQPERTERLNRVRLCQVDLKKGFPPTLTHYNDSLSLTEALALKELPFDKPDARIYIIEDLSTTVINSFGAKFGIDPFFWKGHIDDYLWSTATSESADIKSLDLITRKRPYFTLQYLRPRYYESTTSFEKATKEAGNFNVLRQLDSDRSRHSIKDDNGAAAALMRAKASLWIRPNKTTEEGVLGILLIDPTPSEGHRLWGGYDSFENWSNDEHQPNPPKPPRTSLYDDAIYWMTRLGDADIDSISEDPKTCALPAFWMVLSDWHHIIQYVTAQLGRIEWEIEIPAMRRQPSGIDATMQKLHPWRRNISLYRTMVAHSIDRIFSKKMQREYEMITTPADHGLPALFQDFQIVLDDLNGIQNRIERIVSVAAALLSIEEGRRAMVQNNNVARLTYLATIFIPLSFVSSFLSMQPNISQLKQTIWIFFAIAIPLTAIALLVAGDFLHIRQRIEDALRRAKSKTA